MTIDSPLEWIIAIVVLVGVFKAGQQYESDEAPNRKQRLIFKQRVDRSLDIVAAVYAFKGGGDPKFVRTLDSISMEYPEVRIRWEAI